MLQGTLQGVGKAAITPGSGIGAGAQLAGNLLQGANNPLLQKVGQGLDVVSNFAPGGGGIAGAVGDIAGLAGGAAGGAGATGGGQGLINTLANLGGQGGGAGGQGVGNLLNLASNFLGEQGMAVPTKNKKRKTYEIFNGGRSFYAFSQKPRTQSMQETSPVTNPYGEGSEMYNAYNQAMMALGQSDLGKLQGRDEAFMPRFNVTQAHVSGYESPTYDITQEAAVARGKELGRPAAGRFFATPEEYRESDFYKQSKIPYDQIVGGSRPMTPEDFAKYGENLTEAVCVRAHSNRTSGESTVFLQGSV